MRCLEIVPKVVGDKKYITVTNSMQATSSEAINTMHVYTYNNDHCVYGPSVPCLNEEH